MANLSHADRVLRQARASRKRGWRIIPLQPKSKIPRNKEWPEQQLTAAELPNSFAGGANIGVVLGQPSGGLADIDLDCPEAIAAARGFLPETRRMHGRRSKPSSHFFYCTDESIKPVKFADVDGTVLMEVRSDGQQTVIPPSLHPSGERFRWEGTDEPSRVGSNQLSAAVRRLAACALVARHWPRTGQRHLAAMALSGTLLRNGWILDDAKHFVTTAAKASGRDEDWPTRGSDAETTARKLSSGESVTGIPRLSEIIGVDVVGRLTAWLDLPSHSSLASSFFVPRSHSAWPSISKRAFHGLLGEIVRTIEPYSEADPVALLTQLLVAFGNAAGRKAHFRVEADRHFGNLFVVLVGPTSKGRKGTSLGHIRRIAEGQPLWNDNCVQSGLASGEGLIFAVRDPVLRPARRRKGGNIRNNDDLCGDFGVEDKRLLVVETEFAQPLKLMGRDGNILSTVIRQAWDSGDLRTLTKNSPTKATGAHISIIGHISQEELRRHLSETEQANGFGNRFLWMCARRSKALADGGHVPEEDLAPLMKRFDEALKFAARAGEIKRGKLARELWHDVYPPLSEGKPGLLGALTGRAEAQVTRLSMLYALVDCSDTIRREHLEAALALWDYVEASVVHVFGDPTGDPTADTILHGLRQNPEGLTRTNISSLFARHRSSNEIKRALSVLSQAGRARVEMTQTDGRTEERWFVNLAAKDAKKPR